MRRGNPEADRGERGRGFFRNVTTKLIVCFSLMFILIFAAISVLSTLGVPFTSYPGRWGELREEAFDHLNLIADIKKERLDGWLKERCSDARASAAIKSLRTDTRRLLARVHELSSNGQKGSDLWGLVENEEVYKNLVKSLSNVKSMYRMYEAVDIADTVTGTILASTEEARLGTTNAMNPGFADCVLTHDVYVSDLEPADGSNEPLLRIGHSIKDDHGNSIAVLIISVDPNDIIRPMLYVGDGLGRRGEALLVNKDGEILTRLKHRLPDGSAAVPLKYQIEAEPAMRAARGEEGIIESRDYRGEPVLAAYRHIQVSPDFGWGMVVKEDKRELFHPLRMEMAYSLLLSLIGTIAVVGATIVVARRFTRPLLALDEVASRVAEGDLDKQVPVTTSDEVGHLASTFNYMIRQIKKRAAQLTEANSRLQKEIFERGQVEEELRASEERLKILFEFSPDACYLRDLEGRFVDGNRVTEELTGYKRGELAGKTIEESGLFSPEQSDQIISGWSSEVGKSPSAPREMLLKRKDGALRSIEVKTFPVTIGDQLLVMGVARDVTERKRAEEELENYREHLKELVERRTSSLALANERLQREIQERRLAEDALRQTLEKSRKNAAEVSALLECSKATLEIKDFAAVERVIFDSCKKLIGATAGYIALLSDDQTQNDVLFLDSGGSPCAVDPDLPMPVRGLRAEAYVTGKPTFENQFNDSKWADLLPPGHVRMDNVLFAPLLIQGEAVGVIGLANKIADFTDDDARIAAAFADHAAIALQNTRNLDALRKSEARHRSLSETLEAVVRRKVAELQQAQSLAAVGRMVSVVAHEVRNPLQNIRMGVDAIRKHIGNEKDKLELLEEIEYGVISLNSIITELLEYARPVRLNYVRVPVCDLVQQALKTTSHKLQNITVYTELEQGEKEISVDIIKFTAVLSNLIANAVEAMPGGGKLRIFSRFHEEDGQSTLTLSISDSGCGIDEHYLHRIHEPFFTTKIRGTGLGIPFCDKIVEAHNGRLDIRSESGKGTTAVIRIPVKAPEKSM